MKCGVCKQKLKTQEYFILVEHDGILGVRHYKKPKWWAGRKMHTHEICGKHYDVAKKLMISAGVAHSLNDSSRQVIRRGA